MQLISSGDMLALVAELNGRRIAMICGKMAKQRGGRLDLPLRTLDLLTTARRMHYRYEKGDYRHDPGEADKLRDLCQWLVAQHRILSGQPVPEGGDTPIPWDGTQLTAKTPPPALTYQGLSVAIHDGDIDEIAKGGDATP